jgi:hypothetical protein
MEAWKMKAEIKVSTIPTVLCIVGVFAAAIMNPSSAHAQAPATPSCSSSAPIVCQGDKVIYSSATSGSTTNSHAYVDITPLGGSDICAKITSALLSFKNNTTTYTSGTGVIDARGYKPGTTTSQGCATPPWNSANGTSNIAATVLLPSGVIPISSTWFLPSNTRIIGEGIGNSGQGTVLQWAPTTTGGTMIQMGAGSGCTGVSVENLTLDGKIVAGVNGIANSNCGYLSRVDHVWLYRILGTGLAVSPGAEYSGPYSNITFNAADGSSSAVSGTVCVNLSASFTHGIRKVTCMINGTQAGAIAQNAILVAGTSAVPEASNVLSDIRIEGFLQGVTVGPYASSNVLRNIDGDSNPSTAAPTVNVIAVTCTGVQDLAMTGIGNTGNMKIANTFNYTISDGCTGATLEEPFIATYVLGRKESGGYSRFTTSPYTANWNSGPTTPSGTCVVTNPYTGNPGQGGSLFSATNGASPALWVCPHQANATWTAIPGS